MFWSDTQDVTVGSEFTASFAEAVGVGNCGVYAGALPALHLEAGSSKKLCVEITSNSQEETLPFGLDITPSGELDNVTITIEDPVTGYTIGPGATKQMNVTFDVPADVYPIPTGGSYQLDLFRG